MYTSQTNLKRWYINDKLHRTDGPAIEYINGDKHWFLNGKFHRTDGPAIEYKDGTKRWYLNGKHHRTDGPAVEYSTGDKRWYINGIKLSEEDYLKRTRNEKIELLVII